MRGTRCKFLIGAQALMAPALTMALLTNVMGFFSLFRQTLAEFFFQKVVINPQVLLVLIMNLAEK